MKYLIIFVFILLLILSQQKTSQQKTNENYIKLCNEGYLIIPNMLSHQECNNILNEIKTVEKGNVTTSDIHANKNRKDMCIPVYRVIKYIKKIYEKTKDIWKYVTPNPILCECSALISYPKAKNQAWHSDTNFTKGDANLVSMGIALQDVTKDMGPLHVLKGSNLDYDAIYDKDTKKKYKKIYCTAKKGDMVIWLSSVMHRGSENSSKLSRYIFYFSLLGTNGSVPNGSTYSLLNKFNKTKIYLDK